MAGSEEGVTRVGQIVSNKKMVLILVLLLLFCVVVSSTTIWLLAAKLHAVSPESVNADDFTQTDDSGQSAKFNQIDESVELDPFLNQDKLEFIPDFLHGQGYLIESIVDDREQCRIECIVVPTTVELDFLEMITLLETELWNRGKWEFITEFDDSLTATVNLRQSEYCYQLIIHRLTPYDYADNGRPKLAVVIDDWGYSSVHSAAFLNYPFPLTTAILPFLAQSYRLAEQAAAHGHEVILHQPMEPLNKYFNIGASGILSSMDEVEVEERIEKNIAHLPMIVGVNNHMGSKVTAESEVMEVVLKTLKKHNLYFLDSSTTSMSVVNQVASEIGIPYAVNNQFIDNVNEVEMVKKELRKIIQRALESGSAIVIGHVRSATAAALWEMIPEFLAADIQIVPVSQLLIYPDEDIEAFNNVSEEGVF